MDKSSVHVGRSHYRKNYGCHHYGLTIEISTMPLIISVVTEIIVVVAVVEVCCSVWDTITIFKIN